jgi:hypothetical protein
MAIITKFFTTWDSDRGKVGFRYDDTVAAGFPFGQWTAIGWQNLSQLPRTVQLTLLPGVTSADLSGTVTSIPVAAGLLTPIPSGATVVIGGVSFTTTAGRAVGGVTIPVSSTVLGSTILSGSAIAVPLPNVTIPSQGQTSVLDAIYGGATITSTDIVNLTNRNIPMVSQPTKGGGTIAWVPAALASGGSSSLA